jgi:hypothetical protein
MIAYHCASDEAKNEGQFRWVSEASTHFYYVKVTIIRKRRLPGVDDMITIFCDFCQFSAKKFSVFLKKQCYDLFFHNLALF